ncbi:hypothetical protein Pan241w_04060 [Gimesia alba]|uniref:Uncharacterized protein n=1 Tax=Gimesia alba TaxID=2527973 RepID=A0A517R8Y4_9PLAN|nr:hypothetical protein [Gimesia alba]QDT40350.1 hypothetical protein Pan241w_04060 [Gimesia alba]
MRWQSQNHERFTCFGVSGQVSAPTYADCFVGCMCICLPTNDLRVSWLSFGKLNPSPTSQLSRGEPSQPVRSGLDRPRHPRKTIRQLPAICLPLSDCFPLFFLWSEEHKSYSLPCMLFCFLRTGNAGLFWFGRQLASLHNSPLRAFQTNRFRHDRIEYIQEVRDLLYTLTRQRLTGANFFDVRLRAVFVPHFTPNCMEHVPTTVRHDVDSKMMAPIVIAKPHWFQFWKQPTFVNMQLLARQVDLADDWNRLTERRRKLLEDLSRFQKQATQFKKQEGKWRNLFQTIEWASQPTRKTNKPRVLPGMGLELSLLALHLVVGVAFMMV